MSINEIINGTEYARSSVSQTKDTLDNPSAATAEDEENDFPGLIPIVEAYLDSMNIDVNTRCELATYLDLIRKRASGELWTAAKWIRHYVATHPEYKKDSVVSEEIAHDLVGAVIKVGEREQKGCGFQGLGLEGLDKLLDGFRGGC